MDRPHGAWISPLCSEKKRAMCLFSLIVLFTVFVHVYWVWADVCPWDTIAWIMSCKLSLFREDEWTCTRAEAAGRGVWSKMLADNVSAGKKNGCSLYTSFDWLQSVLFGKQTVVRRYSVEDVMVLRRSLRSRFAVVLSVPSCFFFFDLPLNQCQSSSPSLHHHFCCDFTLILQ